MKFESNRSRASSMGHARKLKWMSLCAIALSYLTIGPAPSRAADSITIEKPWMRFVIKARPAGGFFTLRNETGKEIELVGASSSACGMVMLHQTKAVNGIEKMLPVKSVAVPAHGKVQFRPGGYHLMCMQPKDTMVVGHNVPVILKFAGGNAITAQFPVKGVGGK